MGKTEQARIRYQEILDSLEHLDDEAVESAVKELNVLRTIIERTFVNTDWQAHRGGQLLQAVNEATEQYKNNFWEDLQDMQTEAWQTGLKTAQQWSPPEYQPAMSWAGIGRRNFELYRQNGLFFVTDLADDLRRALSREVLLTTTGLRTPTEAMQMVKDFLGDGKKAANRAQAIVRTEVGRNFAMATQAGMDESAAHVSGMMKMWLHSPLGSSKSIRPAHLVKHGQVVPHDEAFYFPGGPLRFPHDPLGPASETVNCKCRVVPWHPEWE